MFFLLRPGAAGADVPPPPANFSERVTHAGYSFTAPSAQQASDARSQAVSPSMALASAKEFGSATVNDLFLGSFTDPGQHTGSDAQSPLAFKNVLAYGVIVHGSPVAVGGPYQPATPSGGGTYFIDVVVFVDALTGKVILTSTL